MAKPPRDYVVRLAEEKARAMPGQMMTRSYSPPIQPSSSAIEIMGKPEDAADAARMLRALAGTAA